MAEKVCSNCKLSKNISQFQKDRTRNDGYCYICRDYRNISNRKPLHMHKKKINPKTGKPGPQQKAFGKYVGIDGDKVGARNIVNLGVSNGVLENPNNLPCYKCGHFGNNLRHEYHHHLGYEAKNHKEVVPVCSQCHPIVDGKIKTHCCKGHEFTKENTAIAKNGTRHCRECRRIYDRKRVRPEGYWKKVNLKRKNKNA